jgi:hypothetical protein
MAFRAQDLGQGLLAFKAEAISVSTKERALKSTKKLAVFVPVTTVEKDELHDHY